MRVFLDIWTSPIEDEDLNNLNNKELAKELLKQQYSNKNFDTGLEITKKNVNKVIGFLEDMFNETTDSF